MKGSKTTKWIIVAAVAALIASLTTVVILVLRARAEKKAWYEEDGEFGYDLEDDLDNWEMIDQDAEEELPFEEAVEE